MESQTQINKINGFHNGNGDTVIVMICSSGGTQNSPLKLHKIASLLFSTLKNSSFSPFYFNPGIFIRDDQN